MEADARSAGLSLPDLRRRPSQGVQHAVDQQADTLRASGGGHDLPRAERNPQSADRPSVAHTDVSACLQSKAVCTPYWCDLADMRVPGCGTSVKEPVPAPSLIVWMVELKLTSGTPSSSRIVTVCTEGLETTAPCTEAILMRMFSVGSLFESLTTLKVSADVVAPAGMTTVPAARL